MITAEEIRNLSEFNPVKKLKIKELLSSSETAYLKGELSADIYQELLSEFSVKETEHYNAFTSIELYSALVKNELVYKCDTEDILKARADLNELYFSIKKIPTVELAEEFKCLVDKAIKSIKSNEEEMWEDCYWLLEFIRYSDFDFLSCTDLENYVKIIPNIFYNKFLIEEDLMKQYSPIKMKLFSGNNNLSDINTAKLLILKNYLFNENTLEKVTSFCNSLRDKVECMNFFQLTIELYNFKKDFNKSCDEYIIYDKFIKCKEVDKIDKLLYYGSSNLKNTQIKILNHFKEIKDDIILVNSISGLTTRALNTSFTCKSVDNIKTMCANELFILSKNGFTMEESKKTVSFIVNKCKEMIEYEKSS